MTPERVAEIYEEFVRKGPHEMPELMRTILAACREERHAALTEAAEKVIGSCVPNSIGCAAIVIGLRDQEQP